jgi:hypothetical protein
MALFLLILISTSLAAFTGNYPTGTTDASSETVIVTDGKDVGACSCNIVKNSCDTSCCCDEDCPKPVIDLWLSNSEKYCNSKTVDNVKPLTKCVNRNIIVHWNNRMGLEMYENTNENLFCVESDKASGATKFYNPYGGSDTDRKTLLSYYFIPESFNTSNDASAITKAYFTGDLIELII